MSTSELSLTHQSTIFFLPRNFYKQPDLSQTNYTFFFCHDLTQSCTDFTPLVVVCGGVQLSRFQRSQMGWRRYIKYIREQKWHEIMLICGSEHLRAAWGVQRPKCLRYCRFLHWLHRRRRTRSWLFSSPLMWRMTKQTKKID